MNAKKQKLALGAVLAFSFSGMVAHAKDGSVFESKTLKGGYIVAENTEKGDEAKCGEKGKKEAKCGEKCKEGKCGEKGKKEGKCGDEKCKEGKCGEKGDKKGKEGKCGDGTCGAKKEKKS